MREFHRPVSAVGLFAALVAGAEPGAAQEARYRVGLVLPEVVCRVAPSHSANAAGLLKVVGDGWAAEFWVGRTESDETGERWIHFDPGHTGRYGIPAGCWVPESVVTASEGAGHLLQLADRLLSAAAWAPLDHLLAGHNLFVHTRYRQQVEESAILSQRRMDLLAKAVEAAQRVQGIGFRPVDRNPLVLAWIESLGEQVRSSEDRWGGRTWTVNEGAFEGDVGPPESQQVEQAMPREGRELAVIAPDVGCRVRPSRTASGLSTLTVDHHFQTDRADTTVAGEAWVHVRAGCWVLAAHTAPGDSDEHVLAIADRFLTSGEAWSADNRFRLYNVLSSWNRGHPEEVEASPILGLRRLEVLRGACWVLSARESPKGADALTLAWIGALGAEVTPYTAEGHAWTVSDEAYLTLYEKHRTDPFAEEIMWTYASEADAYSCEGELVCDVEQAVNRRLARYWVDYPSGRHIAEAVEEGRAVLAYGLETCNTARGAEPDSRDADSWRWSGWERSGAETVRELLETLEAVREADKAPVMEVLRELEACAGVVG